MKKFLLKIAFTLVLGIPPSINGVFAQVMPTGLDCAAARTWLKQNFYTGKFQTLGYSLARKKMYAFIDNNNDSLVCIYGGYRQFHRNGNETTGILPINCEHTVPQSFFNSSEPMVCDVHHLFPTYDTWNNVRANYILADVADALTTKWMKNITEQTAIPTAQIDDWSEFSTRNTNFEPREQQKGNTARAILYFYTMYGDVMAGYGHPIYDVASLSTLWQWHTQDPPDAAERERNRRAAIYQGNRNPFIDNPEWVQRAFVVGTSNCGSIASATENLGKVVNRIDIAPNPVQQNINIYIDLTKNTNCKAFVYNVLGQKVQEKNFGFLEEGNQTLNLDVADLEDGSYILQIQNFDENGTPEGIEKALKFVKN